MSVTRSELARRLKAARLNCGLTQQQVAEHVGIPRTAVVQIEAGNRAVSSLELNRMARLYGRGIEDFIADGPFQEDPLSALFRAEPAVGNDAVLAGQLRRCANLCREATRLETLLGLARSRPFPVAYALEAPANRWDAITQGKYLAEQERSRLGLGASPAREIAEIIRRQGVRVTEADMPDNISGMFFHGPDVGAVILVNRRHARSRRLFSYAHEYAHRLADRDNAATVSRLENRDELMEVRANAFAAHFLMPEAGVRAFVQTLGKGEASRQALEVFDGEDHVPVHKRMLPGSQDLQVHDAIALAHHFGVSYEAAIYQLYNLKLLTRDRLDALKGQQEAAGRIARVLRLSAWDEDAHWTLTEQILALGFEAYRREEISRQKLIELTEEAGAAREDVELALMDEPSEFNAGAPPATE